MDDLATLIARYLEESAPTVERLALSTGRLSPELALSAFFYHAHERGGLGLAQGLGLVVDARGSSIHITSREQAERGMRKRVLKELKKQEQSGTTTTGEILWT